ncbi:hypothetical protein K1T71_009144 [Dendrolimus kikuchii]|uniref:Uncharacterized protein n=1 Tax=Dendrolimus kikuchii TaxID=765133 RepID=A0ACC1CTW7_9NEOP|nr:hypothetical protein K1T71_009144 [Dendrolimus kikuchii]
MNRLYQLFIMFYVYLFVFVLIELCETTENVVANRPKRFISFRNSTHFFIRFNFKANVIHWNRIFAQALGFRINWDDPPDSFHPYHRLHRRTVYNNMEILLNRNGLNGFHCVRRAVCEIASLAEPEELYHKILNMVFRQQSSATNKWHNATKDDCQISTLSCPFSFLEVSTYTDVI